MVKYKRNKPRRKEREKVKTWRHPTKGTIFTSATKQEIKKWYGEGWKAI